ncbi:MAG: hypothetical protein IPH95_05770 [Candidatus Promineofilum sp.]|jgi:hypothetical protein|nr:hypothetical protein [Promineifilum sp.]
MIAADRPLSELVEALPPDVQESVRDFVEFLLARRGQLAGLNEDQDEERDPFPIDPRRPAMLREIEAYHRLHPELRERYKGQYVAIFQGQLVDHDQDAEVLLERTLARFPDEIVLQRRVEDTPEVILQFRSPRLLAS